MQRNLIVGIMIGSLLFIGFEFQVNNAASSGPTQSVERAIQFENSLVGTWISTSDQSYSVTFWANGETADLNNGNETASGTWHVALDDASPTGLVLRKDIEGERFTYSVLAFSETELSLSYLPRGNTLRFRRQR